MTILASSGSVLASAGSVLASGFSPPVVNKDGIVPNMRARRAARTDDDDFKVLASCLSIAIHRRRRR